MILAKLLGGAGVVAGCVLTWNAGMAAKAWATNAGHAFAGCAQAEMSENSGNGCEALTKLGNQFLKEEKEEEKEKGLDGGNVSALGY